MPSQPSLEQRVKILEDIVALRYPATIKLHQMAVAETAIGIVCDEFYPAIDGRRLLFGPSHSAKVVWYRHLAMATAYEWSGLSTIELGKLFHRYHSVILNARDKVEHEKVVCKTRRQDFTLVDNRMREALGLNGIK